MPEAAVLRPRPSPLTPGLQSSCVASWPPMRLPAPPMLVMFRSEIGEAMDVKLEISGHAEGGSIFGNVNEFTMLAVINTDQSTFRCLPVSSPTNNNNHRISFQNNSQGK